VKSTYKYPTPLNTLQRDEFSSQVPRHFTLKKTPKKAKKVDISAPEDALKRIGASKGALGAQEHARGAMRIDLADTCAWCMVWGTRCPVTCAKNQVS